MPTLVRRAGTGAMAPGRAAQRLDVAASRRSRDEGGLRGLLLMQAGSHVRGHRKRWPRTALPPTGSPHAGGGNLVARRAPPGAPVPRGRLQICSPAMPMALSFAETDPLPSSPVDAERVRAACAVGGRYVPSPPP